MDNVVVVLDSIRKERNHQEYRMVGRARCEEFNLEVSGDGHNLRKLIHLLAENNCDISRGLEVRQGDTLCFVVVPLKSWLNPPDRRPDHLKKARPRREEQSSLPKKEQHW